MRFSPVLLASITASAALGLASSAQASSAAQFDPSNLHQSDLVQSSDDPNDANVTKAEVTTKPSAIASKPSEPNLEPIFDSSLEPKPGAIAPESPIPEILFSPTGNVSVEQASPAEAIAPESHLEPEQQPESVSIKIPQSANTYIESLSGEQTNNDQSSSQASSRASDQASEQSTSIEASLIPEVNSSNPQSTADSTTVSANDFPSILVAEVAERTTGNATNSPAENNAIAPELTLEKQVNSPSNDTEDTDIPTEAAPSSSPFEQDESGVEPRVLIAEVSVVGIESQSELRGIIFNAIQTRPGRTATEAQLQDDINAIFATGYFADVQAGLEDTPLGVRLTLMVRPNPALTGIELEGSVLAETGTPLNFGNNQFTIEEVVNVIFAPQLDGSTLNLEDFQAGVSELTQVYEDNGYVLAQVVDTDISESGVVTLVVAEGVIEDIEIQFLDEEGFAEDEDGNPIDGRTRDFIITREFESQPGDVFNQRQIQQDLQRVFGLGIFDDVRVSLNPGDDPRNVDVVVNVIEGNTGSIAAGAGFSSSSGLFGSASYQQQNLGGNNQQLGTEIQFGQRELLFDVRFTDPWIATDPYGTSYTVNSFLRRSISLIFDGGDPEVDLCEVRNDRNCNQEDLEDGDRPRVQRLGGGVSFSRPLDEWLGWENWRASTGFQYQRVSIRDGDGDLSYIDALGNQLSFSDSGQDDLFTFQLAAVQDLRNNPQQPTRGSLLRLGTEQSIPFGSGSILMNRLRASYSRYVPAEITNFKDGPETLAFNVQAGTVLGDLPPYEAFSLGGTDSVRGYDAGELGSGRSFVQATAEYRFPLFSIIGGALFLDFGSDLGTADNVPGSPAEVRDKPGTGFGYGAGVRVQSPLGQIRVDYGINDDGDGRIHFGIGERF